MTGRLLRTVLITGITGSGGSYLAEHIVTEHPGTEVHGLARWHSTTTADNLRDAGESVHVHEADLGDFGSVLRVLTEVRPDAIFHLAAHANVHASFRTPAAVLGNNVGGTVTLLEAIRAAGLDPVIQICSSSEVYGQVPAAEVPITESAPMRPASPYAVSKCAQDLLGNAYFAAFHLKTIRTRMFTYLNPRRTDLFATSFAKQVAWIEVGLRAELTHGNLDSVRTILDVRDAMNAYWLALTRCRFGEVYNIGGSATATVGEILDRLRAMARRPIPTRADPALLRPADVTLQIPAVRRFQAETGWTPRYTLEESLADLLSYWRRRAAVAASNREPGR